MTIHQLFDDEHYNKPISEMEFKPKLRLGKCSELKGYEYWLESLGIEVKDVWGFYLFDESLIYHYCSPFNGYHSLGFVGWWYDEGSLKVPTKTLGGELTLIDGSPIDSEYIDDERGFLHHSWFEDQIEESIKVDSDGCPKTSILIHDFEAGEGRYSLEDMSISQYETENNTAAEILSEVFEYLLGYKNSYTGEVLLDLLKSPELLKG